MDAAGGADVVVMMDADGQDDPAELPRLLAAIDAGADLDAKNNDGDTPRAVASNRYHTAVADMLGAVTTSAAKRRA